MSPSWIEYSCWIFVVRRCNLYSSILDTSMVLLEVLGVSSGSSSLAGTQSLAKYAIAFE